MKIEEKENKQLPMVHLPWEYASYKQQILRQPRQW
jgi:hypothetical protein